MSNIINKLFKLQILVISSFVLVACSSTPQKNGSQNEASEQINAIVEKMNAAENPKNHIGNIRTYALNNFNNLSSEELKLIQTSKPKIYNDDNTMEYCFAWILPNGGGCLEVVATPPPECTPIAVFRRDRVYFP